MMDDFKGTASGLKQRRGWLGGTKTVIWVGALWLCACAGTEKKPTVFRSQSRKTNRPDSLPEKGLKRAPKNAPTFAAFESKAVQNAALAYFPKRIAAPPPPASISLTAQDGTGLELTVLEAKAVIKGPLAFTELHMVFHNPQAREREGRFQITLPTGATVSRFAMQTRAGWQEAEVVEKQRARRIYEDFLHRRQDPALLEQKAGNEFRARIFPIPANGDKRLILSYAQNLTNIRRPYRLPLVGLPKMKKLQIHARVDPGPPGRGPQLAQVLKRNHKPRRDFELPQLSRLDGVVHGRLIAARIRPRIPKTRATLDSLLVLFDTSASRAKGLAAQVRKLGALLTGLRNIYGKNVMLRVVAFDQQVADVYHGPLGDFSQTQRNALLARRALGASDLENALRKAQSFGNHDRVVIISDLVATAGLTERDRLKAAAKALTKTANRLDVVLVGGIRDTATARALVWGTLNRDGRVLDGDRPGRDLAQALAQNVLSNIEVSVEGAQWSWPRKLQALGPQDSALIFATLKKPLSQTKAQAHIKLSGPLSETHTVKLAEVKKPLLHRAWVRARIAALEAKSARPDLAPATRTKLKKRIVALSTTHRVLSRHTAMLVLESPAEYARYGIKQNALADILVVGPRGIRVIDRKKPVVLRVAHPRPRQKEDETLGPGEAQSGPIAPKAKEKRLSSGPQAQDQPPTPRASPARARPPVGRRPRRRSTSVRRETAPDIANPFERDSHEQSAEQTDTATEAAKQQGKPALSGKFAAIDGLIRRNRIEAALVQALRWRATEPGNVMALCALGDALRAAGAQRLAARTYGSIIDLFPSRADMRRFAGERLAALGKAGLSLAIDTYAQAVRQRPDHISGHHLLAMALLRTQQYRRAFTVLKKGLAQNYPISRPGTKKILKEDLSLVAAAWVRKNPKVQNEVFTVLAKHRQRLANKPSTRFVLVWETDANDVDFHIHDGQGNHASFRNKTLASGGTLYGDVTNGYGPECFTIVDQPTAYPYTLRIHYYSKGPMGYGMGKIQIITHDGQGKIEFADRLFVVMNDGAYVDLGQWKAPDGQTR
jgi:tetratricopeptide (TPR) repeat protein